ncbi:MAG: DUF1553 domain-containing protein, partial [Planctomycetales bacterium]
TATEAYQRESRSRKMEVADEEIFAATCPQPLRSDQLLNILTSALGIPESPQAEPRGKPPRGKPKRSRKLRSSFNNTFGYDPSLNRDEVSATIPQVLFLMNNPHLNKLFRGARRKTMLGKLLAEESRNELVVTDLYLRCLARQPSDKEMNTCLEHVKETTHRVEAFEDILWALVNTAEIRQKK